MQKVHIIGKLKTIKKEYFKTIVNIVKYDKVGWLKDRVLFYPDKDNAREFYKICSHKAKWDKGILYTELTNVDDKKEEQTKEEIEEEKKVVEEFKEVLEKEILKKMSKKALIKYAKDTLNIDISDLSSKRKMIKEILKDA